MTTARDPEVTYSTARGAASRVLGAFDGLPSDVRTVLADGLAADPHPVLSGLGDALRMGRVLGPLIFARTLRRAGRSEVEQLAASLAGGGEPWSTVARALLGGGRD